MRDSFVRPPFFVEDCDMSTGTENTSVEETASDAATTETTAESTSDYGVTDPGYETIEPVDDELAALRAENTKEKPSGEESSGDASSEVSDDAGGDDTDESTEEAEETSTGEGDAATDSADDEISDELLDRAIAVGFELDDVKDLTDAKAFERAVVRVEKLQSRMQGKKQDEQPAAETAETESAEPDWDQMIEDGHDPDIIALQRTNWQRAAAAEAEVKQLKEAERVRAAQAHIAQFDSALNNMTDYVSLFGKGSAEELAKSQPDAFRNREKAYAMMAILRRGYEASGEQVPPDSELIKSAVQAAFHEKTQKIARNSIKNQIKNAGSQALSRPRSGGEKPLSGQAKALAIEEAFWKKHS
jgi:hypothetical protein